jgi:hypothetical protein
MTMFLMTVTIHVSASFIVDSLLQDDTRSGLEGSGVDGGERNPPKMVPKDRGQHEGPVPFLKGYIIFF